MFSHRCDQLQLQSLLQAEFMNYPRNSGGKQGRGNRPLSYDGNPMRKFGIDCLETSRLQGTLENSASVDYPVQTIKEKSRYGNSASTPHRGYGYRLQTSLLRTLFPTIAVQNWGLLDPCHLRPVTVKPVGRIFEISDLNPIQRKCGKCGTPLSP